MAGLAAKVSMPTSATGISNKSRQGSPVPARVRGRDTGFSLIEILVVIVIIGIVMSIAMLSITLAIVNILPIPALDGGHLVFLIYEGVMRREPSVKFRMITQQIGMLVLLAFMAFLIYNDIMRL